MINLYSLIFSEPACGNGLIEDGEGCDCGTQEVTEKLNLTILSHVSY
jgi:hypothetical protein